MMRWRPGNVQPFPSRGRYGTVFAQASLRSCLHCGHMTTLRPPLHPWCEEAYAAKRNSKMKKKAKRNSKRAKKKSATEASRPRKHPDILDRAPDG